MLDCSQCQLQDRQLKREVPLYNPTPQKKLLKKIHVKHTLYIRYSYRVAYLKPYTSGPKNSVFKLSLIHI